MSLMALIILALAASALLGALLVFQGFRGKPVPGTTVCRACRFDLSGLPAASACPECGTPLSNPTAIVPKRARSRLRISAGAFLLVPLLLAAVLATASLTKLNLNPYKPAWLLRAEAHGLSSSSTSAITELLRRYRAGDFSVSDVKPIVLQALPRAETDPATWNIAWSDLIALARVDGLVTDTQWTEYVFFAMNIDLTTRKVIRQGQHVPFGYSVSAPRLPLSLPGGVKAVVQTRFDELSLSGTQIRRHPDARSLAQLGRRNSSSAAALYFIDLPPGTYKLHATVSVGVIPELDSEHEFGRCTKSFERDIEIVAADAPIVNATADPALDAPVRRSLKVPPLQKNRDGSLTVYVTCNAPPVGLAFEVLLRPREGDAAGKEISVGNATFAPSNSMTQGLSNSENFSSTRFDVILRPSVTAAESNYLIENIWTGPDIVFEDIGIRGR